LFPPERKGRVPTACERAPRTWGRHPAIRIEHGARPKRSGLGLAC